MCYSTLAIARKERDQMTLEVDHHGFMLEALRMAEQALSNDETPVGCVFVYQNHIIGSGMNDTNSSLNGTRHAEFQAIAKILNDYPPSIFHETSLYVTVEPCIMCAAALRQYRIKAVYFGCKNDRFGGNGGVLSVHADPGVDPAYPVEGGLFRHEAIMLLRRFYVQQNEKAPEPRMKKNRTLKSDTGPISLMNQMYQLIEKSKAASYSGTMKRDFKSDAKCCSEP